MKISKLTHEITWSWNQNIFDFKMLSHETILKSKDTKKCMTHLLSFNRKVIKTSVFRKLSRKVKIKGKRETWSKLGNLIFQIT